MAKEEIIKELSGILDKIYDKFILRDLFAKIIPGLILIASFFYLLSGNIIEIEKIGKSLWCFLIGLSWIVAYGIQSFGELSHLIKYYNKNFKTDEDWYNEYNLFLNNSTIAEKSICERFIIIKEATGNLAISLILSLILLTTKSITEDYHTIISEDYLIVVATIFSFSLLLLRMHDIHVERQCNYVSSVNRKKKASNDGEKGKSCPGSN